MQLSKWRFTTLRERHSYQDSSRPARIRTDPDYHLSRKKLEDWQRKGEIWPTSRFPNKYSSTELELKIRSRITSVKRISEAQQEEQQPKRAFPPLLAQASLLKRKYVFNFYHKGRQLSMRNSGMTQVSH